MVEYSIKAGLWSIHVVLGEAMLRSGLNSLWPEVTQGGLKLPLMFTH